MCPAGLLLPLSFYNAFAKVPTFLTSYIKNGNFGMQITAGHLTWKRRTRKMEGKGQQQQLRAGIRPHKLFFKDSFYVLELPSWPMGSAFSDPSTAWQKAAHTLPEANDISVRKASLLKPAHRRAHLRLGFFRHSSPFLSVRRYPCFFPFIIFHVKKEAFSTSILLFEDIQDTIHRTLPWF